MFGVARLNTLAAAVSQAVSYITATGGNISFITDGGTAYKLHSFTTTGNNSFVVTAGGSAQYQLVGGGGGSGSNGAGGSSGGSGGGGGGQVTSVLSATLTPQTYTVTVGTAGTAGTSGATGGTGGSSVALGTTVVGGAGSPGSNTTTATAGGAAGGGGSSYYPGGINKTRGTGTQAGGAGANGGTGTTQRAGGGGSNLLAGTGGSAGTGGDGGTATSSTFNGGVLFLGGGGAGAGATSQGTAANGVGVANSGAGANGVSNNTIAFSGTAGSEGWVGIRYPYDTSVLQFVNYITTAVSSSATITIPTIQAGDLVFFFNSSSAGTTAPTAIAPSGWTAIGNTSLNNTTAMRQQSFYKIMTGSESGTTIACMTGATFSQSRLWVYRPNKAITVTISSLDQQTTISIPAAHSKPLSTTSGIFLCFAQHASFNQSPVPSSTSTPTREFADGSHTMRSFETNYSGITWVNQSISMTDCGTNAMTSFIAQIT